MDNSEIDFIKNYFTQEKIESICFILIGIVAISFALINWFVIKYSLYKGLAYPLLVIGFIQLGVGTTIYSRSPKDIIRVEHFVKLEPQKIQTEEIPRMENVLENFFIYKWVEIGCVIIGVIVYVYCKNSAIAFWKGLGLGLMMQAIVMLSLDSLAEKRATLYLQQLHVRSKI